ncbi:hypothetical protein NPIL_688791 [Nephila pilipes]|uniref:Uncharacterized protein n=1 Tax=Nephila pilipes TaxID=299642 RepID=A0A8X6USN2_NEPPI|nr:hypothetical protein NPIL_688791 [Nephila pilipes]
MPHSLTDEQKETCMHTLLEISLTHVSISTFLQTIFTGDKSQCCLYDPDLKRKIMEWYSLGVPEQQKRTPGRNTESSHTWLRFTTAPASFALLRLFPRRANCQRRSLRSCFEAPTSAHATCSSTHVQE